MILLLYTLALYLCFYAVQSFTLQRGFDFTRKVASMPVTMSISNLDKDTPKQMSLEKVERYAGLMGIRLEKVEQGAKLRLEAYPARDPSNEQSSMIGYLEAFIRPIPFKLFQLDTIRVKNQRQNVGYKRAADSWTVDGPGISFVMGSYALQWAYEKGCTQTELLAVKDSDLMHEVLIRLYQSFGFSVVREVGDDNSSIKDRLVWGAVGTLMTLNIPAFMTEWAPKLDKLIKVAALKASRSEGGAADSKGGFTRMPLVALTRQAGANDALLSLLGNNSDDNKLLECIELPCIAFAPGEDTDKLPAALERYDLVVITSPQAAGVFLAACARSGRDPASVRVATVGKGTSKPLRASGVTPVFEPSDSTAVTLAAELPTTWGTRILYPSSALAEKKLEQGLVSRGFDVTRLNTYDTIEAPWSADQLEMAKQTDIVTFASPSTVKVWASRAGTRATAVVIGPTSAVSAEKAGFADVRAPQGSKGVEAWAELIRETAAARL
jgi:uroporphyrinogen-III synthase